MKALISITLLLLCSSLLSAQVKSIQVEDAKRKYLLYLPQSYFSNPDAVFPLVLNFHGGGMTMAEQMLYTGMNKTAEKWGFILVYPAGLNQDWNVGFGMPYKAGSQDIAFIKALLERLKQEYRIDSKAVFATGLSRGGFFCHRLAAQMPREFAAVASVGGLLPDSVRHYHQSTEGIGMMQVQGTDDELVNYKGKPNAYASAQGTFDYWLAHNKLQLKDVATSILPGKAKDETSVTITEASGSNKKVTLVLVNGGGHTWPGSDPFNIGYPLGRTSSLVDINELIWQFFSSHRK